eukprot:scaffold1505_cov146-Skeletonema_marinoi.AAC.7
MGRKRNKGKARKAATAKAREVAEEERGDNNQTTDGRHGFDNMFDSICAQFVVAFRDAFSDSLKDKNNSLSDCLIDAHTATIEEFADVWKDSAKYIEQYIAFELHQTQAFVSMPKIHELQIPADIHSLVKFFRKRIWCSCLDKKYDEVKATPKMGCCFNLQCKFPYYVERNETMYCSRCRNVTYCSRECQKADWTRHKSCCDEDAAERAEFDAKKKHS